MGLILPGQTSANSFGSILYVGLFLPVVLADASKHMRVFARFLPSYYVDDGVRRAMFSGMEPGALIPHFTYLVLVGLVVFVLSVMVLKKKESL